MSLNNNLVDGAKKEIITLNHGAMFPLIVRVLSGFAILFGLALLFSLPWFIGVLCLLVMFLIFVYAAFSTTGVEFSLNTNQVRLYSKTFFKKRGEWIDLMKYRDIAILSSNKTQKQQVGFLPTSSISTTKMFDVFLLGKNHWKKIYIDSHITKERANKQIEQLVTKLNLNYVTFNPKRISKRTKERR